MSELWERKMKTYFTIFDFDHDGVITLKDFELMSKSYADSPKADPAREEKLLEYTAAVWKLWTKAYETEATQFLTLPMFIKSIKSVQQDPEEYKKICTEFARCGFEMLDINTDGYLQEDEHRAFYETMGVPDMSFAKKAFDAIDLDHDGKLSFEEFLYGYYEFMFSDDENSPYNLFFGPLL